MEHITKTEPVVMVRGRFGRAATRFFLALLSISLIASTAFSQERSLIQQPRVIGGESADSLSKLGIYSFRHKISFNLYRGLPAHLVLTVVKGDPVKANVFLETDGHSLVLPMARDVGADSFAVFFPSPKNTLRYRFQLIAEGGAASLTELFIADPQCTQLDAAEAVQTADNFPAQQTLLREALALDRDIDVLKYLIYSIDEVLKKAQ